MSEQEIRAAVKQGVLDALEDRDPCRTCCDACDLEPGQHRDDHQFIHTCRSAIQKCGESIAATLGKGILIAICLGLLALAGIKLGLGGK